MVKTKTNPAAPSDPAAPSAGDSAPGVLFCIGCEDPTTLATSVPTGGRNPLLRKCSCCNATDAAKERKVKQDPSFRNVWKEMTKEEKTAHYKDQKQKALDNKGNKRCFTDVKATAKNYQRSETINRELDGFIPLRKWAAEEISLGFVKDFEDAKVKFQNLLEDPDIRKTKHRGQWLIYDYGGCLFHF